jgi:hypothetical protein
MAKRKKLPDAGAAQPAGGRRYFERWDGFVAAERIAASEAALGQLADDLAALGASPDADAARQAVGRCVQRFNELDNGWICTIEREDIGDCIHDLVTGCGLDWDEEWLEDADW